MKRIYYWAMLLAVLTLGACDEYKGDFRFYENYVQEYYRGELKLEDWTTVYPPNPPIDPETTSIPRFSIDLVNIKSISRSSKYADEYERLAARNGDTNFNSWVDYSYSHPPYAFADNFQTLHVTSNADWDETHPAGTLLDDILQVYIISYGDYIRNGYKHTSLTHREMLISKLTPADMEVIGYDRRGLTVEFTSAPTIETLHTLTVEWTTVEGEVKTASLTCTPEVDPGL